MGAQVGGQSKLHVVLGRTKKGDLIAEIDSVPQLNQRDDKARLQSYESQLAAKRWP
ncbi:MAG: hypothetical protein ACLSAH_21865 [Bilophila wadsworthia]